MKLFPQLNSRFRILYSKLVESNALYLFKVYAAERKLTLVAFVLASLIVLGLTLSILNYYTYKNHDTTFSLHPLSSTKLVIESVEIRIEYMGNGDDKVYFHINFEENAELTEDSDFLITASKNVRQGDPPSNYGFKRGFVNTRDKNTTNYYYELDNLDSALFVSDTFVGSVFEQNGPDIFCQFLLFASRKADGNVAEFPVSIWITNLSGVNINSVWPQPTKQYQHALNYELTSLEVFNTQGGFIFNGSDRRQTYADQFKIFFLGTVLGIFISIIVEIFVDAIAFLEEQNTKYRNATNVSPKSVVISSTAREGSTTHSLASVESVDESQKGQRKIVGIQKIMAVLLGIFILDLINRFFRRSKT